MDEITILITILGMSAVTLLFKSAPLALLGNRRLPRVVEDALKHLPVAVLSGMVVQLIMTDEGQLAIDPSAVTLWAALPTLLVAALTRNLFWTIGVGMGFVAAVRLILG